ncbi:DUF1223 domain-containing protein [Solirhodobacter olei]|uniref:DUF1223 domain-containing protein n=1 Tax=Solirhodobacter olei TaxID=2493082 RepID=UPI0019D4EA96|nr:DUF1223 domain-containing protein [Solirhodobacter olei]
MTFAPKLSALAALALLAAGQASAADRLHPTVVEEFQSQGCNSCPPANANLNAIAGRADVLALSFSVTYWDYLGWKDTFGRPAYTERQWDYAKAGGRSTVYTPQMIGNRAGEIDRAIRTYDRGAGGPRIGWEGGRLSVAGAGPKGGAVVWLVRYDPRTLDVAVRAGENAGRTLPHRNIVKELVRLGSWQGGSASFALPPAGDPVLKTAALVQAGPGGPILAAQRMP